jgi:hypothetical protein
MGGLEEKIRQLEAENNSYEKREHSYISQIKEYEKINEKPDMVTTSPLITALDTQVGGNHYKSMPIQPVEFIQKNDLGFIEGNIVKYICRWRSKGGIDDVMKVIHYAQLLILFEKTRDSQNEKEEAEWRTLNTFNNRFES